MQEKEKNFISAVVYVRNCADEIGMFIDTVAETIDTYFENGEIICVNDESTDTSVQVIRDRAVAFPSVSITILNLDSFHGREAAMQGGIGLSIGDFVWEFDFPYAQVRSEELMKLYYTSRDGADIAAAVCPDMKRTSSRLFYKVFNRFSNVKDPLESECYRVLSRRAINRVYSQNSIVPYRKVAYAACGLKSVSVKIETSPGKEISRAGKKARRTLAADSLLLFTNVGFSVSLIFTFVMMALLIVIAVYAIIVRIMGLPVEGWTSTVLIIIFGFFGLFGILTIITKYMQLIIRINVHRRAFTYESIEKLN